MKTVRNTTHIQRFAIVDGQRYVLQPMTADTFDTPVADAFVAQNTGPGYNWVIADDGMNKIEFPELYGPRVWLANMTGNLDAPAGSYLAQPKVISRVSQGAQTPGREPKSGEETLVNHPSFEVTLWPYQRKSFPKAIGTWFLNRDSASALAGSVIESREPWELEPDVTWNLLDLQVYAGIVDPAIQIENIPEGVSKNEAAKAEQKIRKELLQRLFFRLVDPAYRLPTREEFNTIKRALKDELSASKVKHAQPAMVGA